MVIINYINNNAFYSNATINIRYKLIGAYNEEWVKEIIIDDLYFL